MVVIEWNMDAHNLWLDTVKIWDGEKLISLNILSGHQLGVISTDISSNGAGMFSAGDTAGLTYIILVACSSSLDSQIRFWDLSTNSLLRSIDTGPVESWSGIVSS